jgi:hypothetical protein
MNRSLPALAGLSLSVVSFLCGCQAEHHRWQTVVNEDGSVLRTISRPISGMPDAAQASEGWDTKRFYKDMDRNIWPERITEERINSALPDYQEELNYVIACGTFENLDQVPQHYRYELDGTELVSELKHDLTIDDYGLVKEYIWVEEITDVVRFEDIPAARREMIDLIADIVKEGLHNLLGDEYDASELIKWIRTDGEKLIEECTMLLLDPSFRNLDEDSRKKRMEPLLLKYGLAEFSNDWWYESLRLRLNKGLKRKDGKPVDDAVIEMIVKGSMGPPRDVEVAFERALIERFGDKETAHAQMSALLARQVGLHGVPLLKAPQEFDVWLKLPGEVIETNGIVDEEGFLKWSFADQDIWPLGYRMTARSVLPVRIRNSQVLRKQKLSSRQEMLKFLRLVTTDDGLQKTVQLCLKQNSLEFLKDLETLRRHKAGEPVYGQQIKTVEEANWWRARQLLDLLDQDPPASVN